MMLTGKGVQSTDKIYDKLWNCSSGRNKLGFEHPSMTRPRRSPKSPGQLQKFLVNICLKMTEEGKGEKKRATNH